MHDWMAIQVQHDEQRRHMAWVNDESWKDAPPVRMARSHRTRAAVARALRRLATLIAPAPRGADGDVVEHGGVGRVVTG